MSEVGDAFAGQKQPKAKKVLSPEEDGHLPAILEKSEVRA
jgi:hypothetical protein